METTNLLKRFIEYNKEKRLASGKKRTLLAVSGGLDSAVMVHLFKQADFPFCIAHCNFQLRGKDSDNDERFVQLLAEKNRVEFLCRRFDTSDYCRINKVSIQEGARQLRYAFFGEMLENSKTTKSPIQNIASAHHLNDSIETLIINFTRGTGIRGLRGIAERNGHIIRPLLFATRKEIEQYAAEEHIEYTEDISNASDDYTRNKIRHHVIPVLREINPSLEETIGDRMELYKSIEHGREMRQLKIERKLFLERGSDIYIPLKAIVQLKEQAGSVLFERLKLFGFNSAQIKDMVGATDAQAGKQFFSPTHRLIKDRRFWILTPIQSAHSDFTIVDSNDKTVQVAGLTLTFDILSDKPTNLDAKPNAVYVDADKLVYPLTIRTRKAGDYFYPLGMGMKKKKLKKYFIDIKVPLHEKEKVLVLLSGECLVWVCSYRLDERYKVSPKTKNIMKITQVSAQ